jgi:hypothetical protein
MSMAPSFWEQVLKAGAQNAQYWKHSTGPSVSAHMLALRLCLPAGPSSAFPQNGSCTAADLRPAQAVPAICSSFCTLQPCQLSHPGALQP